MADRRRRGTQPETLARHVGPRVLGVAVAVGAGIFSVGAKAAANYAGPGVIVSFLIAAVMCGLAIMCYAEFASTLPVAGSAYTFSYASMGEFVAWIIGWDLILEMLLGSAVIAKFWGVYLSDAFGAVRHRHSPTTLSSGVDVSWGPFVIVALFTALLVLGTKLSARVNSVFTIIKVAITLFVIVVGFFYINTANFSPFVPPSQRGGRATSGAAAVLVPVRCRARAYGVFGVLSGAALVFFAFIGFDVVATTAEETREPQAPAARHLRRPRDRDRAVHPGDDRGHGDGAVHRARGGRDPSLTTAFALVGADWAAGDLGRHPRRPDLGDHGAAAGLARVVFA